MARFWIVTLLPVSAKKARWAPAPSMTMPLPLIVTVAAIEGRPLDSVMILPPATVKLIV